MLPDSINFLHSENKFNTKMFSSDENRKFQDTSELNANSQ